MCLIWGRRSLPAGSDGRGSTPGSCAPMRRDRRFTSYRSSRSHTTAPPSGLGVPVSSHEDRRRAVRPRSYPRCRVFSGLARAARRSESPGGQATLRAARLAPSSPPYRPLWQLSDRETPARRLARACPIHSCSADDGRALKVRTGTFTIWQVIGALFWPTGILWPAIPEGSPVERRVSPWRDAACESRGAVPNRERTARGWVAAPAGKWLLGRSRIRAGRIRMPGGDHPCAGPRPLGRWRVGGGKSAVALSTNWRATSVSRWLVFLA